MLRVDVISIGCLSRNLLWGEQEPTRTPHATTTLIRTGRRSILVDPALPPAVIGARLYERTGLSPGQIDTVFLTNFRPAHRGGLALFSSAKLLIAPAERETLRPQLEQMLESLDDDSNESKIIGNEIGLLDAMDSAPDKLAPGVDLFPLPGFTSGTCGLLVSLPTISILIAGDGVPSQDHFMAMQVLKESADIKQAAESMREVYEIADLVVPGHDNIFINPRMQGL